MGPEAVRLPTIRAALSSRLVRFASRSPDARLHRVRVKGQQLDAAEPTLGLTRKGDLYYTAFQSNIRIEVLKSRDEGRSWRIVSPDLGARNAHLLSFDPHLYVDSRPRASSIWTSPSRAPISRSPTGRDRRPTQLRVAGR